MNEILWSCFCIGRAANRRSNSPLALYGTENKERKGSSEESARSDEESDCDSVKNSKQGGSGSSWFESLTARSAAGSLKPQQATFDELDLNKNGVISYVEFDKTHVGTQFANRSFESVDLNHDGIISKREFAYADAIEKKKSKDSIQTQEGDDAWGVLSKAVSDLFQGNSSEDVTQHGSPSRENSRSSEQVLPPSPNIVNKTISNKSGPHLDSSRKKPPPIREEEGEEEADDKAHSNSSTSTLCMTETNESVLSVSKAKNPLPQTKKPDRSALIQLNLMATSLAGYLDKYPSTGKSMFSSVQKRYFAIVPDASAKEKQETVESWHAANLQWYENIDAYKSRKSPKGQIPILKITKVNHKEKEEKGRCIVIRHKEGDTVQEMVVLAETLQEASHFSQGFIEFIKVLRSTR